MEVLNGLEGFRKPPHRVQLDNLAKGVLACQPSRDEIFNKTIERLQVFGSNLPCVTKTF